MNTKSVVSFASQRSIPNGNLPPSTDFQETFTLLLRSPLTDTPAPYPTHSLARPLPPPRTHQHARSLSHDEPLPALVPRARGSLRVVVPLRESAAGHEATHSDWHNGSLGATGNHDVSVATGVEGGEVVRGYVETMLAK